jgi:hypothetical protein
MVKSGLVPAVGCVIENELALSEAAILGENLE